MGFEGGIVGGIGWAGILLLGSVFRDIKEDGQTLLFWLLSAGFVLVSVVLITFLGFIASKARLHSRLLRVLRGNRRFALGRAGTA